VAELRWLKVFYSRLEAREVLLDLLRQIQSEEDRGGGYGEESAKDYLRAVLSETEEVDDR